MPSLNKEEISLLKKLNTPIKIQDYLDSLPINWEKKGETYMSVRKTLEAQKSHCFEGALIAAAALMLQGKTPLLMDLKTSEGDDHVIALYKVNDYWGAISKTNHATLRFRDPVYRNIHELALSYFHEYFNNTTGKKILKSYSKPFNLKKYTNEWLISEKQLFHIADALDNSTHYELIPEENKKHIRKADTMEKRAGSLIEWPESDPLT